MASFYLGSLSGGYTVSKHTKETNINSKRLAGSNFNKRLSDFELFHSSDQKVCCFVTMPQCAVTSSPGLLSKCVSSGALSQEELASAYSSQSSFFSSQLHEAEQRIQMQKELEKLQLELELLKQDKKNADVTHASYLAARLQALQTFCTHLQDVLKDHKLLAQRLSRPLGGTSLPIPAHLHRFVVQVVHMAMDFVETLDEKRSAVSRRADAAADLDQLKTSVSQLLAVASEEEVLANRLLGCKDVRDSRLSDSSSS